MCFVFKLLSNQGQQFMIKVIQGFSDASGPALGAGCPRVTMMSMEYQSLSGYASDLRWGAKLLNLQRRFVAFLD